MNDMKLKLIAVAASHVVNTLGLLVVARPALSWTAYLAGGGPVLRNR